MRNDHGPDGVDQDFARLAQLASGTAVIGRAQFLPGYSLLISGAHGANRLTDLPRSDRIAFLADMEALGETVERVCRRRDPGFRRINLEIQGNLTPTLHAHIWPRYDWEPDGHALRQVGSYPPEQWHDPTTALGLQHTGLRDELRTELALVIEHNRSMPAR